MFSPLWRVLRDVKGEAVAESVAALDSPQVPLYTSLMGGRGRCHYARNLYHLYIEM